MIYLNKYIIFGVFGGFMQTIQFRKTLRAALSLALAALLL